MSGFGGASACGLAFAGFLALAVGFRATLVRDTRFTFGFALALFLDFVLGFALDFFLARFIVRYPGSATGRTIPKRNARR
ncbi:MAG TPA: hypothetical protein VLI71_12380 [Gammaproteobacteria bacterium]|nr:hypothetical protein [Gammaproteobacteria bacterium]